MKKHVFFLLLMVCGTPPLNAQFSDSVQFELYKELGVSRRIMTLTSDLNQYHVILEWDTAYRKTREEASYTSAVDGEPQTTTQLTIQTWDASGKKMVRQNYDDDTLTSSIEFICDEHGNEIRKIITTPGRPTRSVISGRDEQGRLIRLEFYEGQQLVERDSMSYELPVLNPTDYSEKAFSNYQYIAWLESIGIQLPDLSADTLLYQFASNACYTWEEENGQYRLSRSFFYNEAGQLCGSTGYGFSFRLYDNRGLELEYYSKQSSLTLSTCYTYDGKGHLVHEESLNNERPWLPIDYTYNDSDQLVKKAFEDSWTEYRYYPNGLLQSSRQYRKDAKGRTILTEEIRYRYDFRNN